MAEREIDSEALSDYRKMIREQLDHLEELIPKLENGQPLGRLPAFGRLDSSETARTNYQTFHQTTWDNLQDLREALYGMIKTLNKSAELSDEAEEANSDELDGYGSLLG